MVDNIDIQKLVVFKTIKLFSFLFSFPQYLGHVEVDESRGMHICEDAVKRLKSVCTFVS